MKRLSCRFLVANLDANCVNVARYIENRRGVPVEKVSFGSQTVTLFPVDELEEAQVGYSVSDSGEALIGENEGDWRSDWFVIAYEDLLGDPFFIDLSQQEFPVFTAAHGEGAWKPVLVASSSAGFIEALKEVESVSKGRGNPVELERNPLPDSERKRILIKITGLNGNASLEFWESWLEI